jgi:hypothetical protein
VCGASGGTLMPTSDEMSLRRDRKLGVSENVRGLSRLEPVVVDGLCWSVDFGALGGLFW